MRPPTAAPCGTDHGLVPAAPEVQWVRIDLRHTAMTYSVGSASVKLGDLACHPIRWETTFTWPPEVEQESSVMTRVLLPLTEAVELKLRGVPCEFVDA